MSDYSQFTTVFRAENARILKRNRQALSCVPCRSRKMKCDRKQPCNACIRRNDAESCRFASAAPGNAPRQEVRVRLQRLEEMVQSLVASNPPAPVPAPTPTRSPAPGPAQVLAPTAVGSDSSGATCGSNPAAGVGARDDESESTYHGATYWAALLDNIRDIQSCLQQSTSEPSPGSTSVPALRTPDILFGSAAPIKPQDVFDCLPSRQDTDRMLAAYFNNKFIALSFVHVPQFQRYYEAFLGSPSSISLLWQSILLSIMSVASMVALNEGIAVSVTPDHPSMFLAKAARCLVAGEYLKSKPFAVEALLAYAHCCNVQNRDSNPIIWSIFGLATRLAQKQGYHRDPSKLAGMRLRPFDGEMRRRTWFFIEAFDILFSFQLGMPAIVHEGEVDTQSPSTLTDDDFDEDTAVLPPPRPVTDHTPALYYAYKSRLSRILRRVIRHALATKRPSHADTMELSGLLQAFHDQIPPALRTRPIKSTSFSDPNYIIMHRLMLELMYSKSQCILHRPYLTHDRERDTPPPPSQHNNTTTNSSSSSSSTSSTNNPTPHPHSITQCRTSALRILSLQSELDLERKPGGRLAGDTYALGSLSNHDFLVAGMVICADLAEGKMTEAERRDEIAALRRARRIWREDATWSRDAGRAERVLGVMLGRVAGGGGRDLGVDGLGCGSGGDGGDGGGGGAEEDLDALERGRDGLLGDEGFGFDFGDFLAGDGVDMGVLDWGALDQFLVRDRGVEGGGGLV